MQRTIIKTTTKICTECGQKKELSEFFRNKRTKDGYTSWCKECTKQSGKQYYDNNPEKVKQRNKQWYLDNPGYAKQWYLDNLGYHKQYYLKRNHGLSPEQYTEMYKRENNCCAICGRHKSEFVKELHVDHHHPSDVNRGMLCFHCNHGIGKFKEDIDTICNAIYYLIERTPKEYFDINETIVTLKTTIDKLKELKKQHTTMKRTK